MKGHRGCCLSAGCALDGLRALQGPGEMDGFQDGGPMVQGGDSVSLLSELVVPAPGRPDGHKPGNTQWPQTSSTLAKTNNPFTLQEGGAVWLPASTSLALGMQEEGFAGCRAQGPPRHRTSPPLEPGGVPWTHSVLERVKGKLGMSSKASPRAPWSPRANPASWNGRSAALPALPTLLLPGTSLPAQPHALLPCPPGWLQLPVLALQPECILP